MGRFGSVSGLQDGSLLFALGMLLLLIFVLEQCFEFLVLLLEFLALLLEFLVLILEFLVLLPVLLRVLDLLDILSSRRDWEATKFCEAVEEVLLQCDLEPVVELIVLFICVPCHEMEGVASDFLLAEHH